MSFINIRDIISNLEHDLDRSDRYLEETVQLAEHMLLMTKHHHRDDTDMPLTTRDVITHSTPSAMVAAAPPPYNNIREIVSTLEHYLDRSDRDLEEMEQFTNDLLTKQQQQHCRDDDISAMTTTEGLTMTTTTPMAAIKVAQVLGTTVISGTTTTTILPVASLVQALEILLKQRQELRMERQELIQEFLELSQIHRRTINITMAMDNHSNNDDDYEEEDTESDVLQQHTTISHDDAAAVHHQICNCNSTNGGNMDFAKMASNSREIVSSVEQYLDRSNRDLEEIVLQFTDDSMLMKQQQQYHDDISVMTTEDLTMMTTGLTTTTTTTLVTPALAVKVAQILGTAISPTILPVTSLVQALDILLEQRQELRMERQELVQEFLELSQIHRRTINMAMMDAMNDNDYEDTRLELPLQKRKHTL